MEDYKLSDRLGHRLIFYTDGISLFAEMNVPTVGSMIFSFPSELEVNGLREYLDNWYKVNQTDLKKMSDESYSEYMRKKHKLELDALNPRKCPLCGSDPIFDRESLTVCCPNCKIATNVDNWEDRDTEDYQRYEIERLRRTIDCLTEKVDYLQEILDNSHTYSNH